MSNNEARQSDSVRSSVVLPFSWDLPTNDEIASLARRLDFILTKTSNRQTIEGALLIALTLQTSKKTEFITKLYCHYLRGLPDYGDLEPGIYITETAGYIVLRQASAGTNGESQVSAGGGEKALSDAGQVVESGCVPAGPYIVLPLMNFVHAHLRTWCRFQFGRPQPVFSEEYSKVFAWPPTAQWPTTGRRDCR